MKTVKLASCRHGDELLTQGSADGHAFRDTEMEREIHKTTQSLGVGAQFGGKHFCHDVRVIRLPRHGAPLPIGLGVSCSADRRAMGKITRDGVFLEELEASPGAAFARGRRGDARRRGGRGRPLRGPMKEIPTQLTRKYPTKTCASPHRPIVVARDLAHAKLRERLESGAGAARLFQEPPGLLRRSRQDAAGLCVGAFGPTCGRADGSFVDGFQAAGGSLISGDRQGQPLVGGAQEACKATAASISPRSAARPQISPSTASRRSRWWNMPSSAWRRSWRIEVEKFSRLHRNRRQGQ